MRLRLLHTSAVLLAQAAAPALRPYQQQCVDTVLARFGAQQRLAMCLPTGSGKTVIFSHIISALPSPDGRATKTLVLTHRTEILQQTKKQLNSIAPHLAVAVEANNVKANVAAADVVVASVHSLGRKGGGEARLERFDPADFKLIVIDEAHHTPAPTYQQILHHYGLLPSSASAKPLYPHVKVLGCTATLLRHDGIALDFFQEIAYHCRLKALVEQGFLVPVVPKAVETDIDWAAIRVKNGDFDLKEVSNTMNSALYNNLLVQHWRRFVEAAGRRSTLVFCIDLNHLQNIQQAFAAAGVNAKAVTGDTPKEERQQTLEDFKQGKVPVVLNVAVLTEGVDLPCIDCIIFARPTWSQGLFQQMLGRGMRLFENKTDCLVLDLVDNFTRLSLESEPTLSGMSLAKLREWEEKEQLRIMRKEKAAAANELKGVFQAGGGGTKSGEEEDEEEDDEEDKKTKKKKKELMLPENATEAMKNWTSMLKDVEVTAKKADPRHERLFVRADDDMLVLEVNEVGLFVVHRPFEDKTHPLAGLHPDLKLEPSTKYVVSLIQMTGKYNDTVVDVRPVPIQGETTTQTCAGVIAFVGHVYQQAFKATLRNTTNRLNSTKPPSPRLALFAARLSRRQPSEFQTVAEATRVVMRPALRKKLAKVLKSLEGRRGWRTAAAVSAPPPMGDYGPARPESAQA